MFETSFTEYTQVQNKIELLDGSQISDRSMVEDLYFSVLGQSKALIHKHIKADEHSDVQANANNAISLSCNAKLPELSLPTFNGEYSKWKPFSDLFKVMIHDNAQLSPAQKLFYLKCSLKNEPLMLIQTLPVTNDSYEIGWKILSDRYDNNVSIINSHIKGIFEIKSITKATSSNLREFITHIQLHLNSLKALDVNTSHWDLLLIYILTSKLDFQTVREYQSRKKGKTIPTLIDFFDFIENRIRILEALPGKPPERNIHTKFSHIQINKGETKPKPRYQIKKSLSTVTTPVNQKCDLCSQSFHPPFACSVFKAYSVNDRINYVQQKDLCFNCFKNHKLKDCKSSLCKICNQKHNSLLHKESHTNEPQSKEIISLFSKNQQNSHVLLPTALVKVFNTNNEPIVARALIDSASQLSFISTSLFNKLGLKSYSQNFEVVGISKNTTTTKRVVDLTIESCQNRFSQNISCAILDTITYNMPPVNIDVNNIHLPDQIQSNLADPKYHTSSPIDLLLGADVFFNILVTGKYKPGHNHPYFQNTYLGWIVGGVAQVTSSQKPYTNMAVVLYSSISVEELLPKFWESEAIPNNVEITKDDQLCEQIYSKTVQRLPTGQYEVKLPFKIDPQVALGDSFQYALKQFYMLEKRFKNNPNLYEQYKKFIHEYIELKHAKIIEYDFNSANHCGFFFPHHGVINNSSATTKLRVVFNGSAKTTNHTSLNDIMFTGPPLQHDLFNVILRFRTYRYAFTADIIKMYRMIMVHQDDQIYQRIIWRDKPSDPLQCIQLHTVCYGTNSAPYLAIRTLLQLANDEGHKYPLAQHCIRNNFYVDDVLAGANTLHDVHALITQLVELLGTAKFQLHKWHANDPQILSIPQFSTESKTNCTSNVFIKTLGLYWYPTTDIITINVPTELDVSNSQPYTKRNILSKIASLFDPLGFVSPVILPAKIILKRIWQQKSSWDEPVQNEISQAWEEFQLNLSQVRNIVIQRKCLQVDDYIKIQLVGFSDASQIAYAACVYIRVQYTNGIVLTNLLASKSRLMPMKPISIPRAELNGALLLSKLIDKIYHNIQVPVSEVFLFSDSMIVLAWIKAPANKWQTYVANRVSSIQQLTSQFTWLHIGSKNNPADYATRGVSAQILTSLDMWWHGPPCIQSQTQFETLQNNQIMVLEDPPEQRPQSILTFATLKNDMLSHFEKFSSFSRLVRVMAYVLRFINLCQKLKPSQQFLTTTDISCATNHVIKITQEHYFSNELKLIKNGSFESHPSFKGHSFRFLNPFVDQFGCLRVGGRLDNSNLPYHQKHPMILPRDSHITMLILRSYHLQLLHAGPSTVLANVRLKYWPIQAKNTIKKIILTCPTCIRYRKTNSQQIMGNLPFERTSISFPFAATGIDYAGPILIKSSNLRKAPLVKGYIALFTCLRIRAVHLELVTDMTTESFIAAFKRFISRRGLPSDVYSDNATNFKGANNKLHELYKLLTTKSSQEALFNFTSGRQIRWHFIPAHSPHRGGAWESLIKQTKYYLTRIMGNTHFTYEKLNTCLIEIESIINSRPLYQLQGDTTDDITYLSPSHFLLGKPQFSFPESYSPENPFSYNNTWKHIVSLRNQFWRKWSTFYLNSLQSRTKWQTPQIDLQQDQIVLIKEDNIPPHSWLLARVMEVYPGSDGKVRTALIKTSSGTYTRSIQTLIPLPKEQVNAFH